MLRMLVPVDGSEGARHAAVHAARLARGDGNAEVHLLNVQEPPGPYGVGALVPSGGRAGAGRRRGGSRRAAPRDR